MWGVTVIDDTMENDATSEANTLTVLGVPLDVCKKINVMALGATVENSIDYSTSRYFSTTAEAKAALNPYICAQNCEGQADGTFLHAFLYRFR